MKGENYYWFLWRNNEEWTALSIVRKSMINMGGYGEVNYFSYYVRSCCHVVAFFFLTVHGLET